EGPVLHTETLMPMDAGTSTVLVFGAASKFLVVAPASDGRRAASPREMRVVPGGVPDLPAVLPLPELLRRRVPRARADGAEARSPRAPPAVARGPCGSSRPQSRAPPPQARGRARDGSRCR